MRDEAPNRLLVLIAAGIAAVVMAAGPRHALAADSAQIARGAALYADNCARCHGPDGKRGEGYQTPIWGTGTQISKFGHAQGLFEYMQMLMPFDDPSRVSDAQKWDILAYMLANHGAVGRSDSVEPAKAASIAIK